MNCNILLSLILVQFTRSEALKCFDCQGLSCQKGFCYGTYCIMSTFKPDNGKAVVLKGCISGNMLKSHIQDQCETFEETVETSVGEKKGKETGYSSRGCLNTTAAPILSRGAINSCSRPGVTESLKIFKSFHHSDFLDVESCLCNEFQFCNFKMPRDLNEERMECPLNLKVERNGRFLELGKDASCHGEYCFHMKLNNTGSAAHDLSYLNLNGCATRRSLYFVEELHSEGCIEILTGGMTISICYRNPEDMKASKLKGNGEGYSPLNTIIVLCFLILIIAILAAGGVLKMDLCRRFMSAHYQSVS